MGSKSSLLQVLAANGVASAAGRVPTAVPKWRRGWDFTLSGIYTVISDVYQMPISNFVAHFVARLRMDSTG
jgi:hypothetical protein